MLQDMAYGRWPSPGAMKDVEAPAYYWPTMLEDPCCTVFDSFQLDSLWLARWYYAVFAGQRTELQSNALYKDYRAKLKFRKWVSSSFIVLRIESARPYAEASMSRDIWALQSR